jgi:uncharacterized protein (TIGR01777 family)
MRVVITGGTGFLGRPLVTHLLGLGYECTVLTRNVVRAKKCGLPAAVKFNTLDDLPPADAVIHLAGESIAGRWTARKRQAILASRVEGTRRLVASLRAAKHRPHTLLAASAVGYYGDRPGEPLDEYSEFDPQASFRAAVCRQWEEAANQADALGIRVVNLRIGNVMDPSGGFLRGLLPLAGVVLGNPAAQIPWISRQDCIRLITFALDNERWYGPVNLTHPEPLTRRQFADTLTQTLRRPSWLRLPASLPRLMLGEFSTALLDDQRVVPGKAISAGFRFHDAEWARFVTEAFATAEAKTHEDVREAVAKPRPARVEKRVHEAQI